MAYWIDLDELALRQYIDAMAVFEACEAARSRVDAFSGGMLWRTSKGHEYLIQTSSDNRQRSLGRRSAATESMYEQFVTGKRTAQDRLRALRQQMAIQYRMNRALRVGDVPALLERILSAMDRRRLHDQVVVAGDCALFAYAAQAGVRLCAPPNAGNVPAPLSLHLWAASESAKDLAFNALRAADKSFIVRQVTRDRLEATNAQGVTVEIRHDTQIAALVAPPGPLGLRKFSTAVVTATGRMARMTAIPPTQYIMDAFHQAARMDLTPAQSALYAWRARATQRLVECSLPHWGEAMETGPRPT
ncbi:hypothetical protein CTP10_R47330 [Cupriavidus sp. P-10]|uniref:hypothetical protein n=1 Tax=Cupriavidus sp. P-10 TaxID=2027911 RepID=UPI000E2EEE68|nr:hypothetical protein [Cupriavidus sp. P-10]BDB27328.1 hypothetical protein CTP10_R47330 [Cupriavidus sp. P-10]